MISDAPITTPQSDSSGRPTLPWITWFVRLAAALNGLLNAFTVGKSNAVTITNPSGLAFGGNYANWAPSFSGPMSISGVTIQEADYLRVGPLCFVELQVSFTPSGGGSYVQISLPFTFQGTKNLTIPACGNNTDGAATWKPLAAFLGAGVNYFSVYAGGNTSTNFVSSPCTLSAVFAYRCA